MLGNMSWQLFGPRYTPLGREECNNLMHNFISCRCDGKGEIKTKGHLTFLFGWLEVLERGVDITAALFSLWPEVSTVRPGEMQHIH